MTHLRSVIQTRLDVLNPELTILVGSRNADVDHIERLVLRLRKKGETMEQRVDRCIRRMILKLGATTGLHGEMSDVVRSITLK